ncbi:MAG TPA: class I SAM-dependent methyltransferase [Pseudonocardia sp.]|uniref:class I SAM-dependent methyltransferase n=1 Tax=Pseudonocardia sp. TaxID=60912 RepID=UPI002F427428
MSGSGVPDDWSNWRDQVDLSEYDRRWQQMAAAGQNPHGEADLVAGYRPASVLDAGCGTGRVAIELARRGIRVVGIDADPDMIAAARAKAPTLTWQHADLATLPRVGTPGTLSRDSPHTGFDVVVLAGNVVPYVAPDARPAAVAACAAALAPDGRLIAGFTLRSGWPTAADYDRWCTEAGLVPEARYATWEATPYTGGNYLVAVHTREC